MSELTYRLIPHPLHGGDTASVDGVNVAVSVNSYVDVPAHSAVTMQGWVSFGPVGATAARPTATARAGEYFLDTTSRKVVFYDGQGKWRDPFTGLVA